ncbi:hypothetical protein AB0C34_17170 [Nocardia sp. NPDC049220]
MASERVGFRVVAPRCSTRSTGCGRDESDDYDEVLADIGLAPSVAPRVGC